jgi:DNA-binding NarL/FixJ family response regulator
MPLNELLCNHNPTTLTKPFTTLIIDTNTGVRQRVRELLTKTAGDDVILSATTYSEATDIAQRCSPDIVILDLHLPGGSGIDLIATLKKKVPPCHVIVFTNSTDPVYKECCLRYGADYFLDKSMEIGKLVGIVTELHKNSSPVIDS